MATSSSTSVAPSRDRSQRATDCLVGDVRISALDRPSQWVNTYTVEKLDAKELVVRNHKKTPAGEPFLPYKWTRSAGWDSIKK